MTISCGVIASNSGGALIGFGARLIDAQRLAGITASQVMLLRRETL